MKTPLVIELLRRTQEQRSVPRPKIMVRRRKWMRAEIALPLAEIDA